MAGNLEFHYDCVVWTTERPFTDRPRTSPVFSILGWDWYSRFKITCYGSHSNYCLTLVKVDDKAQIKNVKFAVFIEHNNKIVSFDKINYLINSTSFTDPGNVYTNSGIGQWMIYCFVSEQPTNSLNLKRKLISESTSSTLSKENLPEGLEALSSDLSKMLEQKSFPDVTNCCGDCSFPAHRSVLAARSDVFAAMFQNEMVERQTGKVVISDISGAVFDLLLKYMYSGKMPDLSFNTACSLYTAADKYNIHSLKQECSKWMLRSLNSREK